MQGQRTATSTRGGVWWAVLLGGIGIVFAACATETGATDDGVEGPRTSDGALLTLESDRGRPVWSGWSPAAERQATPESFGEHVRAFDYWQVDDPVVVEDVWAALFPVLDAVRARTTSGAQEQSLQLALEAIEPGTRERSTRMDLTFLVSADGAERFEGLACRLYRRLEGEGVTPIVTVVLMRRPSEASDPSRIAVWVAPGFEQPDSVTALFERRDSTWRQRVVSGLASPVGEERPSTDAGETGRLAARVLTKSIWKRFAGNAYLESPQSGSESQEPSPEDVDTALGLEVQDRMIDQVYSDTTFPPRADLDEL